MRCTTSQIHDLMTIAWPSWLNISTIVSSLRAGFSEHFSLGIGPGIDFDSVGDETGNFTLEERRVSQDNVLVTGLLLEFLVYN